MLILTRKFKQGIIINDNIKVSVIGKTGEGQFLIGIEAPKNVNIAREELTSEKIFNSFKSSEKIKMKDKYPKLKNKNEEIFHE